MNTFQLKHRMLYAAMDIFPSAKGAATHIQYFAEALYSWAGDLGLLTLGDAVMLFHEQEENIELIRFNWLFSNYLERALSWTSFIEIIAQEQKETAYIQFRDPWSGIAFQNHSAKKVFEVNALPSLELPMIYPLLPQNTRNKIITIEKKCLSFANQVITPSIISQNYLIENGVNASKIKVIPNGFDPKIEAESIDILTEPYILYFGALQPWQGVDILLRAYARVRLKELKLVICASNRKQNAKILQKLAQKLGLSERVIWFFELPKPQLKTWIQGSIATVAPLTHSIRNTVQGCNPLKIIESAGYGTPVIASDLPVVKEILTSEMFWSCKPNQVAELARTIEQVLSSPDERKQKAMLAQQHVLQNFTWEKAAQKLIDVYQTLD